MGRLAIVLLLAALPAPAAALTLRYDVRYGPLRLLAVETTVELDAAAYRTRTRLQTVGVIGMLFPWTSESVSEGARMPPRPRRHVSEGRYRGDRRLVELTYDDDGGVAARVEPPPEGDWRDAVPDDQRRATVDPLTASLVAMENGCRGRVPVFDGRRRYDLRLEPLGEAVVPADAGIYEGPARRCRAVVEPKSGFWRSDGRDSEVPGALEFWIAPPRPDLPPSPVYLELSGARGTLRIGLTGVDG